MDTLGYFDSKGRPQIVIEVKCENIVKEYEALVDSGADNSLLPKRAGLQLGLKLPSAASGYSTGVGGRVPLKYVALEVKFGPEVLRLKFAWLYTCDDIPVIIGRKGIFNHFNVDFRQKENKIIFKRSK